MATTASASASASEYEGEGERRRTLLDVTLPEVARILEMQQQHIVVASPSPALAPATAPATVLGVPLDVFRALEPALLERVLRALGGPAEARAGAPRSE